MLLIACGGLLVNLAGLWILGGDRHENLNVRVAWLHELSDALGSAGAIAAGVAIWGFGWMQADALASVAIAAASTDAAGRVMRPLTATGPRASASSRMP